MSWWKGSKVKTGSMILLDEDVYQFSSAMVMVSFQKSSSYDADKVKWVDDVSDG